MNCLNMSFTSLLGFPCFWWRKLLLTPLIGLFVNYQINFLVSFQDFLCPFIILLGCVWGVDLRVILLEYIEPLDVCRLRFFIRFQVFSPHFFKYLSCSFLFPRPAFYLCACWCLHASLFTNFSFFFSIYFRFHDFYHLFSLTLLLVQITMSPLGNFSFVIVLST